MSERRVSRAPPGVTPSDGIRLSVLGAFDLSRADGGTLTPALPHESQRLLALLALRDRLVSRAAAAGTLWPDTSEKHALASLRSALSRLNELAREAVIITDTDLRLSPLVALDLREARLLARRLLDRPRAPRLTQDLEGSAIQLLSCDCLPDWYEEWVLMESEEWRQLRLHALSILAMDLVAAHRFGDAVGAALAAVRGDPLRESARATLIRVHLAEGNRSEALRAFDEYQTLLLHELGEEPTPALRALASSDVARHAPADRPRETSD